MNARSLNARAWIAMAMVAGVCVAASSFAVGALQPAGSGGSSGQPGVSGSGQQQPLDAKTLRELIEKRIEDHKQGIKRLDDAAKKLAEGGDPATIGKELLESFREDRRGGNQRAGGTGAPGRQGASTTGGGGGGRMSEYDMLSGPRLSADDRAKVRAMLDERHPELLRKVLVLGGGSVEMTDRLIDGVGGRLRWLESMREKDPEEFGLRINDVATGLDVMKLGRDITEAKKNGNTSAEATSRSQLRDVMAARFDNRQKLSKLKIKQILEQANRLEKEIAKNDQERDAVIDRRMDEFLKLMEGGKGKKAEAASPGAPPAAPARKP